MILFLVYLGSLVFTLVTDKAGRGQGGRPGREEGNGRTEGRSLRGRGRLEPEQGAGDPGGGHDRAWRS